MAAQVTSVPQREHVHRRRRRAARDLLGGHPARRPHHRADHGDRRGLGGGGHAEVDDHRLVLGQQDVARLQVAVGHAGPVDGVHRFGKGDHQGPEPFAPDRTRGGDLVQQGRTIDVAHGQVGAVTFGVGVEELHDAPAAHPAGREDLPPEAGPEGVVGGQEASDDLERDRAHRARRPGTPRPSRPHPTGPGPCTGRGRGGPRDRAGGWSWPDHSGPRWLSLPPRGHHGGVTTAIDRANAPLDFLGLDGLLDDEERLLRDTVRAFVVDRVLPDIARMVRGRDLPGGDGQGDGCAGPAGHAPRRLRLRRDQRRQLRAGLSGAGGGRQRVPQLRVGPGLAGHVPHPRLRQRGAEAGVAAGDGGRRGHRLLRPDRARLGQRPVLDADAGPAGTGTTGCSTARRCGSPTAAWPTSRWSGR